jgi:D-alanyl-D-alanine dipeptidase
MKKYVGIDPMSRGCGGPRVWLRGIFLLFCANLYIVIGWAQTEIVSKPADAPTQWKELIGIYASLHDTVYVAEKSGDLCVVTKKPEYVKLHDNGNGEFGLSVGLLLGDTALSFQWQETRHPQSLSIAGIVFQRLIGGSDDGTSFRIKPLKPADELRRIALAAAPPRESGDFLKPDLVDLATLDSTIRFDIRYATTNNFVGEKFYRQAKTFLQRPAAEALLRAHGWLRQYGFGLLIHDAYRPWYVTKMFWDATPDDKKIFVANPSEGSRHNRGCAVDLTLYDLKTGKQVAMTGGYDEMSVRSYADYPGGTSLERWHRDLLRKAMTTQGFAVYQFEWWHFDYKDWKKHPIGTKTFEEVSK